MMVKYLQGSHAAEVAVLKMNSRSSRRSVRVKIHGLGSLSFPREPVVLGNCHTPARSVVVGVIVYMGTV